MAVRGAAPTQTRLGAAAEAGARAAAATDRGQHWEDRTVPLRIRCGGLHLFTGRLRLRTYIGHFADLPAAGRELTPPVHLPPMLDGVLVRSRRVHERLSRLAVGRGCLRYVPRQYQRRTIDLRQSFHDYERHFSARSRSTMRRKIRRLAEHNGGVLDLREYRLPGEVLEFHRLARAIARRTYQERLFGAGLPQDAAFEREMRAAAGQDRLRSFLLFVAGEPVAYLYCPIERDTVYYRYVGHDPRYAALSPGSVLLWSALERLFAEKRFATFDFTDGDGPHKAHFATHSLRCADVYYLRWSAKTISLVLAHAAADGISSCGAGALRITGLYGAVRRWLRRS